MPFGYNFCSTTFFATTFFFQFGSLSGNRFFSLYSEGCILGTDQKCPDYPEFSVQLHVKGASRFLKPFKGQPT